MGTDKRDRQRANKAIKQQQAARAETKQKGTRLGLIIGGSVVAVLALVFIANAVTGGDDATGTTLPEVSNSAVAGQATGETTGDSTARADGEVFAETGEFVPNGCPSPDHSAAQTQTFDAAPPMCLDSSKEYTALVTTNKGEFTVAFDPAKAPLTVNNFVFLARNGYFDGTTCHRIIPGFVAQCGDPTATGTGGPGYEFADELPQAGEYQLGSLAMANSGPNTNGSQFFIITGEQGAALAPNYSLFGEVTSGFDETVVPMEAAGTASGAPSEPVDILSVVISTN